MTNFKIPVLAASEEHLSADLMCQYLDNQLPAEARHRVEKHLLDCSFCTEALEGINLTSPENTRQVVFELNHRLRKRTRLRQRKSPVQDIKTWALAAAIIMILFIAALIVWFQVKHQSGTAPTKKTTPQEQTNIQFKSTQINTYFFQ